MLARREKKRGARNFAAVAEPDALEFVPSAFERCDWLVHDTYAILLKAIEQSAVAACLAVRAEDHVLAPKE